MINSTVINSTTCSILQSKLFHGILIEIPIVYNYNQTKSGFPGIAFYYTEVKDISENK